MFIQAHKNPSPKILIISDNAELSSHVITLLNNDPKLQHLTYDVSYSFRNNSPEPMKAIGATSIDLSDENLVKRLISSTDLILSLHCKQIFPQQLVDNVTCINVHPGFNPYNRGWFPQIFSIINGLPTGVTIHRMDREVDHGPIIYQKKVQIHERDTSLEVYRKIIALEKEMLNDHFIDLVFEEYQTYSPKNEGNYNSVSDFKKLCEIQLNHIGTMKEHINLLRALSHGPLKNAYFLDVNGKKNYIQVTIKTE